MEENKYPNNIYALLASAEVPEDVYRIGRMLTSIPEEAIKERYEALETKLLSMNMQRIPHRVTIAKDALMLILIESQEQRELDIVKKMLDYSI